MVTLQPALPEDSCAEVSALVHSSFLALAAAAWSPQARQTFLQESSPDNMRAKIAGASVAAAAYDEGRMVGFLLMPTPGTLGMLFVDPECLRRGIAQRLWEHAREAIERDFPATKTVELNSTPYAVGFYRSMGFVPISSEFEVGGCRATRMACWLPARKLGAELPRENPETP